MNEERKEVKRVGRQTIIKTWIITKFILQILIVLFIFQLRDTICNCIGSTLPVAEGEYTLSSSLIASISLKITDDGLYQIGFNPTIQVGFIILVVVILGIITLLPDHLLPMEMDCHYVILWNKKEDYFSVSFPEIYEIVTPIQINCRFHMQVGKKIIKINDGNTILKLPYDKGAETLLWKIQKE